MSKGLKAVYSVQAFKAKGRSWEAEPPQQATDEAHALRMVERKAEGKAGAVALRQDGDPATGDLDEPVVLKIVGTVPHIFRGDIPF